MKGKENFIVILNAYKLVMNEGYCKNSVEILNFFSIVLPFVLFIGSVTFGLKQ